MQQISVALGLHFFVWDEAQSCAVDAVAHAVGRLRVAGEHMTEMGVSGAASDLRAAHSVAQILFFHHSAALRFVPYEKMETEGYGYLLYLFEK